jgi:hypothetical protein
MMVVAEGLSRGKYLPQTNSTDAYIRENVAKSKGLPKNPPQGKVGDILSKDEICGSRAQCHQVDVYKNDGLNRPF